MRLKHSTFLWVFLATTLIFLMVLPAFNYALDRYRVFHDLKGDYSKSYMVKEGEFVQLYNDRIMPVSYLINHPHDYDSVIFGNSRTDYYWPEFLGRKWFRVNYRLGRLYEHLHHLKILINKVPITNILLCLDQDDFITSAQDQEQPAELNRLSYPHGLLDWLSFYKRYLFKQPNEVDFDLVRRKGYKLAETPEHWYMGKDDWRGWLPNKRQQKLINKILVARNIGTRGAADENIRHNLRLLKEFVQITRDNHIKLTILFHPIHYKLLYSWDIDSLEKIKKAIVSIHPYYDFGTANFLTMDNAYWMDIDHYDPYATGILLTVLSEKKSIGEFGTFVTQGNIDAHLQTNRTNLTRLLPKFLLQDSNLVPHDSYFPGKTFFNINAPENRNKVNYKHLSLVDRENGISFTARQGNPTIIIPALEDVPDRTTVAKIDISSSADTAIAFIYTDNSSAETMKYFRKISPGDNVIHVPVKSGGLKRGLMLVIKQTKGEFTLNSLEIKAI